MILVEWSTFEVGSCGECAVVQGLSLPASSAAALLCLDLYHHPRLGTGLRLQMMVLLSGLLPHPEVTTAVMGWLFNYSTLAFLIPLGLSGMLCDSLQTITLQVVQPVPSLT